jgi:imidazoleglycerol-phosphate dehydratase
MDKTNLPPDLDPENFLPKVPPEQRDGTWLRIEGDEDNTHRPAKLPDHIRRELLAELVESGYPPVQFDEIRRLVGVKVQGRSAQVERRTAETAIELQLNLDGTGTADITTGVGFFDHMLTLLAKHSLIDLTVKAAGDLNVDPHHTVEDVGICFGKALAQALGNKSGIRRYGSATLPMDEVLVTAAIDLSGRPFCVWNVELPPELLGTFNAPLAEEYWRAAAASAAINLHVICHHGRNSHHIIEAVFKSCARALRQAVEIDPRVLGVPSTKGTL